MIKINFDEYDQIKGMEKIVYGIINMFDISKTHISLTTYEHQILYELTIISILYKEKCYEEYLGTNVNGTMDIGSIDLLNEIIDTLYENLNSVEKTIKIIKNNGFVIQTFLERYFNRKQNNYIAEKYPTEIIAKQKKQKDILKYNPFMINQILEYEQNPLTKEEIYIQEICEFLVESEQIYDNQEQILNYIKELMTKNYKKEELDNIISFIIGNIYQEMKENLQDEDRNIIVPIIENERVLPKEIIEHFKRNNGFSNTVLKKFLYYNKNIEKGRLEELEKKQSKIYAKRIYNKNP